MENNSCFLTSRIFQDPYILEKIFNSFDNSLISLKYISKVRLVCKDFNSMYLKHIEKRHRKLEIRLLHDEDDNTIQRFNVNGEEMNRKTLSKYFEFLTNIVRLQVEQVIVKHQFNIGVRVDKEIHDIILLKLIKDGNKLRKLVGLAELCDCCAGCLKIAEKCLEYGPIKKRIPSFDKPKHFKQLIISDSFLGVIANYCVRNSHSQNQCHEVLYQTLSKTNISCLKLVLWIDESRSTSALNHYRDHMNLPREVLEGLLKTWKVVFVEVKLIFYGSRTYHNDAWSQSGYFTSFRFNSQCVSTDVRKHSTKFKNIHVDLSDSYYCVIDLNLHSSTNVEHRGYEYLIANIKRLFNVDEISINIVSNLFLGVCIRPFLDNLLRVSRIGFHQNLKITVRIFADLDDLKIVDDKIILFDIPEEFQLLETRNSLHFELTGNADPMTRKCTETQCNFKDLLKNMELHVNVLADVDDVDAKVEELLGFTTVRKKNSRR
ncbi:unnamed protein product [Caenorhabditis brenneri]